MFLLFFLCKFILCLNFEIPSGGSEIFEENIKAGTLYKLEYNSDTNESILLNIIDNAGNVLDEWNTSFNVVHFKPKNDISITMTFKNLNNKTIKLKLNVPDLDNESTDANVSGVSNIQSVHELEQNLKSIIIKTSDYTEKMKIFSNKMASYKWKIRVFMGLELLFCAGMIYFLHKNTVGLFERRRKI